MTVTAAAENAAPVGPLVRFGVAARPMKRFSNEQSISLLSGPKSFAPIPLSATGFVRKVSMFFTLTGACGSAGAVVAGDGPWNLLSSVTLTDATGQPIFQPLSGYHLYLINKWLPTGIENFKGRMLPFNNPHLTGEFAYSATGTTFTAKFRLDLELEIDAATGYGCVPNLDANASLQLKIDAGTYTNAFSGTGVTAVDLSVRIEQHYWSPVPSTMGGVNVQALPPGYGDFVEWRYENQAAVASAENTVPLTARGGLIRGVIAISRAAGVRTDYTANSNVGLVYDNTAIDEGIRLESHLDQMRRQSGYIGADITTSYAALSAGVLPGADRGVLVWNFDALAEGREAWLSTRPGTLLQLKVTPGAAATQLEIITGLAQVRDMATFYGPDPA